MLRIWTYGNNEVGFEVDMDYVVFRENYKYAKGNKGFVYIDTPVGVFHLNPDYIVGVEEYDFQEVE